MDMIEEGDISGAIQQCVASCSSLNLSDGAVMGKFMHYLENKKELKCFELPDGTAMSYDGLVKYFEKEIHPTTADAPVNETPSENNVGTEEMEEINNGETNQDNAGNG